MANENVIEVQRKIHEERERIEDAIAKEMLLRKSNVSEYTSCPTTLEPLIMKLFTCRFVTRSTVSIE